MWSFTSNSPQQTIRFGKYLAKFLTPDSLLALSGQLGSGKTTLVKGIAAGLGIDKDRINSPTFVLIREYEGGRLPLFHFDFYRLDEALQFESLGIEDYYGRNGVLVMEWSERAKRFLPEEYLAIRIICVSKNKRFFKISAKGKAHNSIIAGMRKRIQ